MNPVQPDPEPTKQSNGQMPPPQIIKPDAIATDSAEPPKTIQVSTDSEADTAPPTATPPAVAADASDPAPVAPDTPLPEPLDRPIPVPNPEDTAESHPETSTDTSLATPPAPTPETTPSVPSPAPATAALPADDSEPLKPAAPLFAADAPPSPNSSQPRAAKPKKNRAKWLLPLVVGLIVLLGGSAAAYVGYYVPNKPANMWRTALTNSGKGYDALSRYATTNKQAKGVSLNGSFKLSGGLAFDGTLSGQSNGANSEFTSNVSTLGLKVNADVRTIASPATRRTCMLRLMGSRASARSLATPTQA